MNTRQTFPMAVVYASIYQRILSSLYNSDFCTVKRGDYDVEINGGNSNDIDGEDQEKV